MPRILSAAAVSPENRCEQREIEEACVALFPEIAGKSRLRAVFARSGVEQRALAEPLSWYLRPRSFADRNAAYLKHARDLGRRAVEEALKRAGLGPESVSHIFFVTTTGLLTPSLDAYLANALPFPPAVKRSPLFGVGCAGGVVGLERAFEYLEHRPGEIALLLSVELCSLCFLPEEPSLVQWIGASLFADGAAAVVIGGDGVGAAGGPEILGCRSRFFKDSLGLMGWEFGSWGMRLVLSPEVPRLARENFGAVACEFLAEHELEAEDVGRFLVHPGSSKVVEACCESLSLEPQRVSSSLEVLAEHGNMSSATALFILERELSKVSAGEYGLMAAFGPGFSCETALLRF